MNYWKVIVATVVIFGTGVFTGGLLVNYVHLSHIHNAAAPRRPLPATSSNSNAAPGLLISSPRLPEILSKPFLPKLDDLLHLSPNQHKAIEKIITEAQGEMRKVTQDSRTSIRAELTPDQRSRFDEVMKRPIKRLAGTTNTMENLPTGNLSKSAAAVPTNPPVCPPTNPPAAK